MSNLISVLPSVALIAFVCAILNGNKHITNFFMLLARIKPFIFGISNVGNHLIKEADEPKGFLHFFNFICENNPLLINYDSDDDELNIESSNDVKVLEPPVILEQKYEDKYLSKFKHFPNEYQFTDQDIELENQEYERLKIIYEQNRLNIINGISDKLKKINVILETNSNNDYINDSCKNLLLQYFCLNEDEDEDEDKEHNFNNLLESLLNEKIILESELNKNAQNILNERDLKKQAHEFLLKTKHDQLINNYILEFTPLGNVYMRYNNDKKSFEYFSNNSIPYRYLEPVGRRYVMTYWCKSLFVDIEEELKIAEQKQQEEKLRKEEDEKHKKELSNKSKDVLAKLKNYNKDIKLPSNNIQVQAKNRGQQSFVLPPQIKANLPNVNQTSGKQLLKENANRYTWEGRLSNFSPLKKVNKTVVNKNLTLTFADFKRIHQKNTTK